MEIQPGGRVPNAPKAVIVAMHWLQAGGAERWGMETIALAKEAGFIPIVLTDCDSHQPWITDPACDDALVLPLTQPLQERVGDPTILRALFEQFDIRGILIHHCQWMYDRAWWVKQYFPKTFIVDSLHIVEYVHNGGYPYESWRETTGLIFITLSPRNWNTGWRMSIRLLLPRWLMPR